MTANVTATVWPLKTCGKLKTAQRNVPIDTMREADSRAFGCFLSATIIGAPKNGSPTVPSSAN
jgi:hypothetical protein